jgi:uncharacterized RDD family membrane protein YckC
MNQPSLPAELEYVGFWPRTWAAVIDSLLLMAILLPVLHLIYGAAYWESESFTQGPLDFLLTWVLPAVAAVMFWVYRQATPGKMAIGAKIVDATTFQPASTNQLVGRYAGYYLAMIPLFAGIVWVAFDARKQGWHDKVAGTVVVRTKRG